MPLTSFQFVNFIHCWGGQDIPSMLRNIEAEVIPMDANAHPKSKGKIVFVDDSPTVLDAVTEWLKTAGYEVIALSRSFGASRVVMRERPQAVLLDIRMPGLSGDRLAKLFAQNPVTASIPVIFHSEIEPAQLAHLAQECAVVGAIPKTGNRAVFLREFDRLVSPFLPQSAHPESVRMSSRSVAPILPEPQSVGIEELDEQHGRITHMLNRMSTLNHRPEELESRVALRLELKEAAAELLVFMRFHLATEDRYMRERGHSRIDEHRAEHVEMLKEMVPIAKQIESSIVAEILSATRHLREIVLEHMHGADMEFSAAQ